MAVGKTLHPHGPRGTGDEVVLTFVVPAPQGCNMGCSFCAIAQRKEDAGIVLSHNDYREIAEEVIEHLPVNYLFLQGYEPLLPESWETSMMLLEMAERGQIPHGIITNGWHLAERAVELAALKTDVCVSLDSPIPREHDMLRRTAGAFERALGGLQTLLEVYPDPSRVGVGSILIPGRSLSGMPKLLASLGIRKWVIGPLINFRDKRGTRFAEDEHRILTRSLRLKEEARQFGIEVVLDDELNALEGPLTYFEALVARHAHENLIRIVPTGKVALGEALLKRPVGELPVWHPREISAHDFVNAAIVPQVMMKPGM